MVFKGFFRGQVEIVCRSFGGNNQCVVSVFVVIVIQMEWMVLQIYFVDMIKNDFSFKFGGMFVYVFY